MLSFFFMVNGIILMLSDLHIIVRMGYYKLFKVKYYILYKL